MIEPWSKMLMILDCWNSITSAVSSRGQDSAAACVVARDINMCVYSYCTRISAFYKLFDILNSLYWERQKCRSKHAWFTGPWVCRILVYMAYALNGKGIY